MTFSDYQTKALGTAIYPGRGGLMGLLYVGLKLAGEAGENAEKLGKMLRDNNSLMTPEIRMALLKELGDVLWYVAAEADELGSSLEEVARLNNDKLADRVKTGTLQGSGDDRESTTCGTARMPVAQAAAGWRCTRPRWHGGPCAALPPVAVKVTVPHNAATHDD